MSYVKKEDWRPQGVDTLEDNAWKALRETECSVLVTAGAGAGKTEFLAQKAAYLLQTGVCPAPKRILAISFKKDAAHNLAERVEKRCPKDQARRFVSLTFDAFTKGLFDRFRAALPEPYNSTRPYRIILPTKSDYDDFLIHHGFSSVNSKIFEIKVALTDLPIVSTGRNAIDQALKTYWNEQFSSSDELSLSFPMLNRLVKLLLQKNIYIRRALHATYPVVFLDEFQDTTYAQYDLLLTAFDGSHAIFTAVGDDKQRIMGWAGAMPDAFNQFEKKFNAKRISLVFNWRSHAELVRIQHKIACQINDNTEQIQARGICSIAGTVSAIWQFQDAKAQCDYLAKWICREVQSGRIKPHDVAILIRQKAALVEKEIAPAFGQQGLRIRNVDRVIGNIKIQDLLGEDLTGIFIPLLRLGTMTRSPENWALAQKNQLFLEAADLDDEHLLQSLQSKLGKFVQQLKAELAHRQPDSNSAEEVANILLAFVTTAALRQSFPAYQQEMEFKRVWTGFVTLLKECAEHNSSWNDTLNEFEGTDQVALMTVHKSKGLEFHTMIFYGLDNRSWWSLDPKNSEELNAFFVAFTRAKQRAFFSRCDTQGEAINWIEALMTEAGVKIIDGTRILEKI